MRKLEPWDALEAPAMCFACEQTPQREAGVDVFDCEMDIRFEDSLMGEEIRTYLSGKRYLCMGCVKQALNAVIPGGIFEEAAVEAPLDF